MSSGGVGMRSGGDRRVDRGIVRVKVWRLKEFGARDFDEVSF